MGRDKSWIKVNGVTLIERQVALARTLNAEEVFISGRSGVDYGNLGCPVLHDRFEDSGPLAGIESGLAHASSPLLLVLAVDLPRLEGSMLSRLLAQCSERVGVVPEVRGHLEPLVAVYPKQSHRLAEKHLQSGRLAVTAFALTCLASHQLIRHTATPEELDLFENWNTPRCGDESS